MLLWLSQLDWALFASALISSTLFPGGSEALLLFRLENNQHVLMLVLMATFGNVLGSIITYGMGRYGLKLSHRWLQTPEEKLKRAEHQFNRFGKIVLLFAWLPIIGDPLCLVAGILRYHFLWFVVFITLGKLARYTFIVWLFL
ncbi:MAG: YqaA family protein [Ghiorsea sp.]